MVDSDEPPSGKKERRLSKEGWERIDAIEMERARLVRDYIEQTFTPEELLDDLGLGSHLDNPNLNVGTKKMKVSGGFCKYMGDISRGVVCPGMDTNCQRTKLLKEGGCKLHNGYRDHKGILSYYLFMIDDLKDKGVDVSKMGQDLEFIKENYKRRRGQSNPEIEEKFVSINKMLGTLHSQIEKEYSRLEVLSS